MFTHHGNSGFYKTPVSKCALGSVVLASFALNVPLHQYQHWFIYAYSSITYNKQIWRLFTSKLVFLDSKDLICGAMLIYYFKTFEKKYGSQKFCSYLLCMLTLSTGLEVLVQAAVRSADISLSVLPSGPYFMIFPWFVPFYFDIPRVALTTILGIPVTGKSFHYILGLQIASSSAESFVVAVCGIVSGLLCRKNIFYVQSWLRVPNVIADIFGSTLGRIFNTPKPPGGDTVPMGATLAIQREQQIERLEQQMAWAQIQQQNTGGGFAALFGNQNGFAMRARHNAAANGGQVAPPEPASESQVQQLVDMGFNRESVLAALRASNNDMQTATTVLLQES